MLVQRPARLPVPGRALQRGRSRSGRPGNLYIREDRILPHLPALHLLLTGAQPAAGRRRLRTRHGADVNRPPRDDDVIGYLRARKITLTYYPATGTLRADTPGEVKAVIGPVS